MGLSVEEEASVVPYTQGSPLYMGQEAALVILFHDSDQYQRATTFIAALRSQVVSVFFFPDCETEVVLLILLLYVKQ